MWDKYYSVTSINQALDILDREKEQAKIIAGGTDLILEIRQGVRKGIESLVDISRIPEITEITLDKNGFINLGAGVTHNHCVASKIIQNYAFPLAQACYGIGTPQIRNVATVVGNLVTASPANDTIASLIALDAEVVLASIKQKRIVKLTDFYTGVRSTVLHPDEMVIEIRFKKTEENQKGIFKRYMLRQTHAISVVNTAIVLTFNQNQITKAAISLGCVAPTVFRVEDAEQFLIGKALSEDVIEKTAELAQRAAKPINDIRSSDKYRSRLVKLLVSSGLTEIWNGDERKRFPSKPVLLLGKNNYRAKKLASEMIHDQTTSINTRINGKEYSLVKQQRGTLIDLIRESAGLVGTKLGCGEGECGACTLFMDGIPVLSCLIPAPRAHGAEITTIEGVSEKNKLHVVQQAFIDEGAIQCGYCTPGFVMSSIKLLEEISNPSYQQIQEGLAGNLCRCTGYYRIIAAVEKAAQMNRA